MTSTILLRVSNGYEFFLLGVLYETSSFVLFLSNSSIIVLDMENIQNIVSIRAFIKYYSVTASHFDDAELFYCFFLMNIYFGTASIATVGMSINIEQEENNNSFHKLVLF